MTPTTLSLLLAALIVSAPDARAADPTPGPASDGEADATHVAPAELPEPSAVPPTVERGLPAPDTVVGAQRAVDEGDDQQIEQEIEAQSAEMEQMREAEEKATLLQPLRPDDSAVRSTSRLGLESPLRLRLEDAFNRATGTPPVENRGRIALLPQLDHDLRRLQAEYDIPIEVNEAVLAYIRFFQTEPARKHFVKWLGRSYKYMDRFRAILRENGLPEDTVFLAMIESGFANLAYSRARASGPWQFIAGTGKRMGLKQDFWVDERRDPEKAARAAARYLKELYDQTGDWRLAWAGYNAGVGKIFRAQRKGQADFWSMTRGRVLRKETKGYVPKLMAAAIITKHQEAFGFRRDEIEPERWIEYERVTIPHAAELRAIAEAAGASEKDLLELNPELRRSCTPPHAYSLKIPKGSAEAFAKNWPEVADSAKLAFAHHRVQRGDTLAAVAAAYEVSPAVIMRMNGLRPGRRLHNGSELVIPLTALARRSGKAPATEVAARTRIQEIQRRNPATVEAEPPPRPMSIRTEEIAGRMRATVLVRAGDTLWDIAQKFGVGVAELARWNGIQNPRRFKLQIGKELVVYPRASAGPG